MLYFCKKLNIKFEIIDKHGTLPEIDFIFNGTLKGYQQQAVRILRIVILRIAGRDRENSCGIIIQ